MKEAIPTGRRLAAESTPERTRVSLAGYATMREIFLMSYRGLLQQKKIAAIEALPEEKKRKLWKEAKTWLSADTETMKDLCRCLHALEYFEQEKQTNGPK